MKNGKRPTKNQSIFIEKNSCLDPNEWLVAKDTPTILLLVSRKDKQATITLFKD